MGLPMNNLHAPTVSSGPTSHSTSNGTDRKQTLPQLVAQKENVEAELSALSSVLDSHGVNMNTSLTTFDGFPRSDIDVAQVRTTRARIIRLKNDYKSLMVKIEAGLEEHFAAGKTAENEALARRATTTSNGNAAASSSTLAAVEPPFARVNSVVPASPAESAGLKAEDKIVRFGSVHWQNHEKLSRVAQIVQQNENVRAMSPLVQARKLIL